MSVIGHIAKALGRISGEASVGFGEGKALSSKLEAWKRGQDLDDDNRGAQMVSPYQQSAWIYTAISAMAEGLAQIPFRISRVGSDKVRRIRALRGSADPRHREMCNRALGENIVESGDVVDLFDRPHPTIPRTLFWEQIVSWDALRGEFFLVPLDEADGIVDLSERSPGVRRLLTLDPAMFWHMVSGFELIGWRYTGSPLMSPLPSIVLAPSEVIHARAVNPYLYWRGLSPLTVALLPASADFAASMFMKGLLMNNADTGVIATTEQNLTPEQCEQFTAALRERKRKAGTPDRPLFLSSGVKIEKPTISNVDMQFLETRKLLRQEIGAIYKVPESVMGFSESKSSSLSGGGNALNEEKLTFIQQNLGSKCHRYEAAVEPIIKTFGDDLVGWFDLDSLPVMQDARRARVDTAAKVFEMGVPLNDVNRVYDLGFPEYKWGKVGLLPFNLQPAQSVVEGPEMPGEDNKPPTGGNGENGEETPVAAGVRFFRALANSQSQIAGGQAGGQERKVDTKKLWERHIRARNAAVKLFQRKVCRVLNEFRGKVLAKLTTVHLEGKGAGVATQTKGLVDLVFNPGEFGNALVLVLEQPMRSGLQQAGDEALREVGENDPWEAPPKFVTDYLLSRKQPVMGVGATVRDRLNTTLEAGLQEGETTGQLASRVREVFNDMTEGEALRVARTETHIVYETARDKALDQVGITHKAWLSSHGPAVRPGHAEAEETYIDDPIPSSEPFIVDMDGVPEQLMFPGDDSLGASLGNIINCQCVRLAAEKEEEDEKGAWFKVFGMGRCYFPAKDAKHTKHCCH
ncbi:MAG: phage portal protein [Bryobacteraceae bacterium]